MNALFRSRLVAVPLLSLFSAISAADQVLDEIVVSADFRDRVVAEIATSITVMDSDFIKETAVQHFEELIGQVPNLNWSGDGHRARYFQIRGVGELEQYQSAPNSSVGFLIDDIDFSGIGTVAILLDMQSVEVLRGSQGSRYGANALGGLIYMRSTEPSAERDGRVELTVAGDDAISVGAAFGGALNASETTTFRFSAQKYESNGFRSNPFLNRDDSNGRDETSARLRLRFELTDTFAANIAVMYTDIDNGYDAFALDNSFTVLSDRPGKDAQESVGASVRMDWSSSDELTVTSLTTLADTDIEFGFDADWGNDASWTPFTYDFTSRNQRERKTISQEFRVVAENWLFGIYAQNLREKSLEVNVGVYVDPFVPFSSSLNSIFDSRYDATNIALFGQYDHALNDTTRLSSGLRFERRNTDYSDSAGLNAGPAESLWGGELSIKHDLHDAAMVYATISKGYKAGGFNLGAVPVGQRNFGAEIMWSVEAGIKSRLINNTLQLNAAIFRNRREDQQVRSSLQLIPGDPASFVFFTDNIGKGKTLGAEAEIRWFVSEFWELYANIGLLDATSDSGREQPHAPSYSLASGFVFRHPHGIFVRVDATAKDEFFFDVSHDQQSQAFKLLNTRIGYEGASWRLSVWAHNLLDEDYAVRGFFFGNEPPNFPATLYTRSGDPRQVGITIAKRF